MLTTTQRVPNSARSIRLFTTAAKGRVFSIMERTYRPPFRDIREQNG
jgi:hypothetical protein